MKKIYILIACFMLVPAVMAAQFVPVNVDVSIDFRGERSFNILLPNGFERQVVWDNGTQHSDMTFSHTIYWQLDETKWCSDNSELDEYKALTGNMTRMLGVCEGVISTWNRTDDLRKQAADALKDRDIYSNMYTICEEDRKEAVNSSKEYKDQVNVYKSEAESCQGRLSSCQQSNGQVNELQSQLSTAVSSKNNWAMGGLLVGLLGGWFMWGKKKGGVPSEHARFNVRTDAPSDDMGSPPPQMRFSDGPRQ
jgi:hypothetical protein